MAVSRSFRVYEKLPIWMQNIACTLAGIKMRYSRYNRSFHETLRMLEESDRWSLEQLRGYQQEQLGNVIRHAYNTVPYYRELFDNRKLTPNDVQKISDLPKLPILEKRTVRERSGDLISTDWPRRRQIIAHTGGTTGTSLKLVSDINTQPAQWAVWWRHRRRFGVKLHDPFIVFAGRPVVPLSNMKPPFWRRNLATHQTYVSVHHLTKQNMPYLVDYLQKRNVVFYSGYPSGLYLVATYLLDNRISLKNPPKITFTGSETLLPHQRRVISLAFNCDVADHYGATEQCCTISECEKHSYHVDMEFGIIEFLPVEGAPSNVRRIVGTGFYNPAMPLIRYNIGDLATICNSPCPCGRQAPTVERIDGRIESYVITRDGRQLGRFDFLFKNSDRIHEAQLVQDTLDHLVVKVVRCNGYSQEDEDSLLKDLRMYLGDMIHIDIDYIEQIPCEPNGKFRQIVSKVFRDHYAECEAKDSEV